MPLGKKRQAEYMHNYRKTVIPSVIPKQAWEITNWASVDMSVNPHFKARIPNCKDGRYRE